MRRLVCVFGFVLPLLAGSLAAADPPRSAVEVRLSGFERAFTAADLTALGQGADRVLVLIADDAHASPITRARAVSALAYARTTTARAFLEGVLHRKGASADATDRLLLRKAAMALGWQVGPAAVPKLAPLLRHEDEDVRLDATIALGLTRAPAAADALRGRLDEETSSAVRYQLGRQLRLVEAGGATGSSGAASAGSASSKK